MTSDIRERYPKPCLCGLRHTQKLHTTEPAKIAAQKEMSPKLGYQESTIKLGACCDCVLLAERLPCCVPAQVKALNEDTSKHETSNRWLETVKTMLES